MRRAEKKTSRPVTDTSRQNGQLVDVQRHFHIQPTRKVCCPVLVVVGNHFEPLQLLLVSKRMDSLEDQI